MQCGDQAQQRGRQQFVPQFNFVELEQRGRQRFVPQFNFAKLEQCGRRRFALQFNFAELEQGSTPASMGKCLLLAKSAYPAGNRITPPYDGDWPLVL